THPAAWPPRAFRGQNQLCNSSQGTLDGSPQRSLHPMDPSFRELSCSPYRPANAEGKSRSPALSWLSESTAPCNLCCKSYWPLRLSWTKNGNCLQNQPV